MKWVDFFSQGKRHTDTRSFSKGAIQAICDYYNSHRTFLNGPVTFRPDPNHIILEICTRGDRRTNYAVIEPSLWSQLVQHGSLVKVWNVDDGSNFMNGPVYLCFAKRAEGALRTVWTVPGEDDMIDRPLSYKVGTPSFARMLIESFLACCRACKT